MILDVDPRKLSWDLRIFQSMDMAIPFHKVFYYASAWLHYFSSTLICALLLSIYLFFWARIFLFSVLEPNPYMLFQWWLLQYFYNTHSRFLIQRAQYCAMCTFSLTRWLRLTISNNLETHLQLCEIPIVMQLAT